MTSCEDFLDNQPIAKVSSSGFYNDEKNAQLAVNAIYDPMGWGDHESILVQLIGDCNSDDCEVGGDPSALDMGEFVQYSTYKPNPSTFTQKFIQNYYVGIQRANNFLEQTSSVDFDASKLRGEASFMRALYYFDLVRVFGPVPLMIHTGSDYYLTGNRQSGDDAKGTKQIEAIYAQIVKDLEYAASTLPTRDKYSATDAGRATKGAAWGLLAKVYAFEASYNKIGFLFTKENQTKLWENVTAYADSVINFGGSYALNKDYHKLFTLAGENDAESLFEIQYVEGSQGVGGGNKTEGTIRVCDMAPRSWFDPASSVGILNQGKWGYGLNEPTISLVSEFDLNKAGTIEHYSNAYTPDIPAATKINGKKAMNMWILNDMKTNQKYLQPTTNPLYKQAGYTDYDPRIDMIVKPNDSIYDRLSDNKFHSFCSFIYKGTDIGDYACTGFWNRKTLDGVNDANSPQVRGLNFIVLRLADIILLKAEAEFELGNEPQARTLVNEIRTRARNSRWEISPKDTIVDGYLKGYKITSSTVPADYTTPITLNEIYKERRMELFCEGHRFYDIVRWGLADKICPNRPNEFHGTDFKSWKGKYSYFQPIPPILVSEGKGNVIQNPGY